MFMISWGVISLANYLLIRIKIHGNNNTKNNKVKDYNKSSSKAKIKGIHINESN